MKITISILSFLLITSNSFAGVNMRFTDSAMTVPAFFSSTEEAQKFGKENPQAFEILVKKRDEYLDKYERINKRLAKEDSTDLWNTAFKFATQAQFMREAYEQIDNAMTSNMLDVYARIRDLVYLSGAKGENPSIFYKTCSELYESIEKIKDRNVYRKVKSEVYKPIKEAEDVMRTTEDRAYIKQKVYQASEAFNRIKLNIGSSFYAGSEPVKQVN